MIQLINNRGFHLAVPERSTLFLSASVRRTALSVCQILEENEVPYTNPYTDIIAIPLTSREFESCFRLVACGLDSHQMRQIRCLLSPNGIEPQPSRWMQSYDMVSLLTWINGQWLTRLLDSNRLVTYFQPIVSNRYPHDVFAYECLLRGKREDGEIITPDDLYSAARATGQLNSLDSAARLTAIETATLSALDKCVFINFNPRSIDDPARSMTATLHAALTSGIEPENFVFEVVESDEILDINALITILACCRDVGCRVALDDLGAGHSSLSLMTRIQPDFVKLDMELIRNVDRDEYKSCVAGKILEIARELGVKTVVEGVESELEWQWARDHGADFSQGFFFAAPQEKPPALRLSDPFANSAGDNRNSEYQSALESLVVQ